MFSTFVPSFPLSFYSKGALTLHWAPCFPRTLLTALGTLGLEGEDLWFWLLTGPSQPSCSSPTKNPGFKTCQCTRDCFPALCHHLWKFSHASSFLSEHTSWIIAFISGLLASCFLIIKCTNFDHLSNGHTSPPGILASNYLSSSLAWL